MPAAARTSRSYIREMPEMVTRSTPKPSDPRGDVQRTALLGHEAS